MGAGVPMEERLAAAVEVEDKGVGPCELVGDGGRAVSHVAARQISLAPVKGHEE